MHIIPADKELRPLIKAIATGEDRNLVRQLIEKSCQSGIVCYTPNDKARRFKDEASFKKWKAGGREMHWLLGEKDDLAGILWYGRKDFPLHDLKLPETPEETLAIRLYDGYTGHGLARPAMRQSLVIHVEAKKKRGEPITGLWLQTDVDNKAALAVYGKFGYHEVFRDGTRVTMILPAGEVLAKCAGEL